MTSNATLVSAGVFIKHLVTLSVSMVSIYLCLRELPKIRDPNIVP